jgi:putative ABC transport system permease protein
MNLFFVRLSWKNLWRNRRRTFLTVSAIACGLTALIGIYNFYEAFHEQVIRNVIRYQSGHLLVSAPSAEPGAMKMMDHPEKVLKWLRKQPEIKAAAPRLQLTGLLSSPKGSANTLIVGIVPEVERQVTYFHRNLTKGDFFAPHMKRPKGKPIVIGLGLKRKLKLDMGSKVVALTQGTDGSIGNELFYVAGVFLTHSEMDNSIAFVLRKDAELLLSAKSGAVHQIAIVLKQDSTLPLVQSRFQKDFYKKPVQMLSWMDIQKPLMAMIDLNKSANSVLMFVILGVAAFGVANAILMGLMERTREFGVMVAIGTHKHEVRKMVVAETILLSSVGAILGNIMGYGMTLFFGRYGFDLQWLTKGSVVVGGAIVQTITYPRMVWGHSFKVTIAILLFSFCIALLPVRHIGRLEPVKALRG